MLKNSELEPSRCREIYNRELALTMASLLRNHLWPKTVYHALALHDELNAAEIANTTRQDIDHVQETVDALVSYGKLSVKQDKGLVPTYSTKGLIEETYRDVI